MPFIRTHHPHAGDDINGVRFVPHPEGGKVSAESVPPELAAVFFGVAGFESCPNPGSLAAVTEQVVSEIPEVLTIGQHRDEIEKLESAILDHQNAIIQLELAELRALEQADKPADTETTENIETPPAPPEETIAPAEDEPAEKPRGKK